jgi:hypothetical protein
VICVINRPESTLCCPINDLAHIIPNPHEIDQPLSSPPRPNSPTCKLQLDVDRWGVFDKPPARRKFRTIRFLRVRCDLSRTRASGPPLFDHRVGLKAPGLRPPHVPRPATELLRASFGTTQDLLNGLEAAPLRHTPPWQRTSRCDLPSVASTLERLTVVLAGGFEPHRRTDHGCLRRMPQAVAQLFGS